MKIFIFNDLETGSYFDYKNVSTCKYSTLENEKDVLFVFPDQMLTHVNETEKYKKRANLEAKLINDSLTSSLNIDTNLNVLKCSFEKGNYFLINDKNLKKIKNLFQNFENDVLITSDVLFFSEIFKENINYLDDYYLNTNSQYLKFSKNALKVLKYKGSEFKKIVDEDLIKNVNSQFDSYKLNTFNIGNLINFEKNKKYVFGLISAVVLINLIGIGNLINQTYKLNSFDNIILKLYEDIYPLEKPLNVEQAINKKIENLNLQESKVLKLIYKISSSRLKNGRLVDLYYSKELDKFEFEILFNNSSEEIIFLNEQAFEGNSFRKVSSRTDQGLVVTKFIYEI